MSVCQHSHSLTVEAKDTKFGVGMYLDHVSNEFNSQGHRSKVKVARLKNVVPDI